MRSVSPPPRSLIARWLGDARHCSGGRFRSRFAVAVWSTPPIQETLMKYPLPTATAAVVLILAAPLAAQEHAHPASSERLGTVHFETSCAPAVSARFDRAIALLHSFEFGASIRAFEDVARTDSTCAMAWWGIALSQWTNPMTPSQRPTALLERGRRSAVAGARVGNREGTSQRERDYLAAVAQLYTDYESRDQRTRVVAYEKAMADLAAKYPDDQEATVFHAIALVGAALPTDKSYANQLKAGAILEQLFAKHPDHPGLAHYIIHSYDVPALAGRAAAAARRYADIAPSAAHALHMPSHTFTRVGLWNESVTTNLRSMEAAGREASIAELLHAADYAVYAYLQTRRDSAARAILLDLPRLAARFDPQAVTGAAPGSAGVFALAAIPARYALERDAWREAAALRPSPSEFPHTDALTWFARALGAAHERDTVAARVAIDSLALLRTRLANSREPYWAEQVAIQHLGASAWLDHAAGRHESALQRMREAATREDATEKAAVTPGPLMPARELLGDMLLELNRPAEALAAYTAALEREPNRHRSLRGAWRAAAASGDRGAEARYAAQLKKVTGR
jgi:hypothetical protein